MTKEIKIIDYEKDKIECNLCRRWMSIKEFDSHYEKCLDIEYLVNIAKEKGESFERKDIENCRQDVINKLLKKYPPEKIATECIMDIFK